MLHNLTNFLPPDRLRTLRTEYLVRLATLTLLICAMLGAVHALLLFPTYKFVIDERAAFAAHLAEFSRTTDEAGRAAFDARMQSAHQAAERLVATQAPGASDVLRALLEIPRPGVSLTGFTMDTVSPTERRLRITGIASTRESLRQYHQSLSSLPNVTKTDLPLSAYAKETDIPFTIMLTGTLSP